jgi:hypothetical protein
MKGNLLLLLLNVCLAIQLAGQTLSLPPSGDNPKCTVMQYIGGIAHVTVTYSSPDVDGRAGQVWGQLVPYGLTDLGFGLRNPSPWRAGANENTVITFSHDVLIDGQQLKAGTYGLHVIVEESGPWTWIFSHNSSAWGSYFYNSSEDALRAQAAPEIVPMREWLTYDFVERKPHSAVLALQWETKSLPMRIEVATPNDLYASTIEKELQGNAGFTYQNWAAAAGFLAQENYKLDKALEWAEAAISAPFVGVQNFATLQTKATVLLAMDKTSEAGDVILTAIADPSAQAFQIHQFGRQLITLGHPQIALDIFEANHERFEGAWPTNVGMARGLSAMGRYEQALKYASLALAEAPDQVNKDNLERAITQLQLNEDIN